MDTFVTFDLDYWTMTEPFDWSHEDYLYSLIRKAKQTKVIKWHHHLISYNMIPKNTDHIINIDFHNDIVDDDHVLNEGTWGNFIPKSVKKFTWVYPDLYRCILQRRGICMGTKRYPKITHVQYEKANTIENITIPDKINKFVICISEYWAENDLYPYMSFIKQMKKEKLID